MYSLIFTIARKYASKVLIGILVFLVLTGIYLHWRNSLINQGRDAERVKWEKREAEINRQSAELMKLKEHEVKLATEQNRENYLNAIQQYAKNADDVSRQLAAANKRLYVRATCSSNPVPGKATDSSGSSGENAGVYQVAELDQRTTESLYSLAGKVELGKRDCGAVLDYVEKYFKVE